MIQANELRMGNWIITPSCEYSKVGYEIIRYLIVLQDKPNYQPIPLTEEILLKCRFEQYGDEKKYF